MKILFKSAWGSDDPTRAAFPFLHAKAFAEAGHESQREPSPAGTHERPREPTLRSALSDGPPRPVSPLRATTPGA